MTRNSLRAAVLGLCVPLVALLASPALAVNRDDGDDPGPGLSVVQTVSLFVLIPAGAFLVIALLVYGTASARKPRYRPGIGWFAEPAWFNGPAAASSGGAAAPAVRAVAASTRRAPASRPGPPSRR